MDREPALGMEGSSGLALLAASYDRGLIRHKGDILIRHRDPQARQALAGKLSRIVAILKSAPRQIVSADRKGKSEAPAVPPPGALRNRQAQPADAPPPRKDSRPK